MLRTAVADFVHRCIRLIMRYHIRNLWQWGAAAINGARIRGQGSSVSVNKCVFIHTNERQWLGALVSQYSLKRNSGDPDAFDVQILHTRDFPYLQAREGDKFLRGGVERVWHMDDLQSFTPLRFQPPAQMQWQGRAVLIDPDIFALGSGGRAGHPGCPHSDIRPRRKTHGLPPVGRVGPVGGSQQHRPNHRGGGS